MSNAWDTYVRNGVPPSSNNRPHAPGDRGDRPNPISLKALPHPPRPRNYADFGPIARGTSVSIPCRVRKYDKTPFDLTDYHIFITVKNTRFNSDYQDDRAFIAKEITVEKPLDGEFFIRFSSREMWLPEGKYTMDIMATHSNLPKEKEEEEPPILPSDIYPWEIDTRSQSNKRFNVNAIQRWSQLTEEEQNAVVRLAVIDFTIIGGPTNRLANDSIGYDINKTDRIDIELAEREPFVFITPLVSDPPYNLVETILAEPHYLLERRVFPGHESDKPVRHVLIKNHGPRLEMFFSIMRDNNDEPQDYLFSNYFPFEMDEFCPLKDGYITLKNRELQFHFHNDEILEATAYEHYIQHVSMPRENMYPDMPEQSPELTIGAEFSFVDSSRSYFVGWDVTVGHVHFDFHKGHDTIWVDCYYHIPLSPENRAFWSFDIKWQNWYLTNERCYSDHPDEWFFVPKEGFIADEMKYMEEQRAAMPYVDEQHRMANRPDEEDNTQGGE